VTARAPRLGGVEISALGRHRLGSAVPFPSSHDAAGLGADAAAAGAGPYPASVTVIMLENRSFDHYFGTFAGAEGIKFDANGVPKMCYPLGKTGSGCVRPYHDRHNTNGGANHSIWVSIDNIDNNAMDGIPDRPADRATGTASPATQPASATSCTTSISARSPSTCSELAKQRLPAHATQSRRLGRKRPRSLHHRMTSSVDSLYRKALVSAIRIASRALGNRRWT
jgi:Phosphoesterase family